MKNEAKHYHGEPHLGSENWGEFFFQLLREILKVSMYLV